MYTPQMLEFFDGNCVIGKKVKREAWEVDLENAEDLNAQMEYFNIREALVYHLTSKNYDPRIGNNLLLKELKDHSNIHPQWVLTPDIIWEASDLSMYMENMLKAGVKAVRMFPKTHGFILNKRTCGVIMDELGRHRIPLFIDLQETSWKELYDILEEFPDNPFVITQLSSWGDDRYFYPLLRDFKNFYIELCFYRIMGGLEAIRDRFGVDRLIFGSGLPDLAPGAPVSMILYSGLSQQEKEKVAYGNIKKLLEGVSL